MKIKDIKDFEIITKIIKGDRKLNRNPNWKNGISKNKKEYQKNYYKNKKQLKKKIKQK